MISMDTKQEIIRRYFREFDSERKICRDLQINRDTVKKQLVAYVEAEQIAITTNSADALQDFVSSPPKYNIAGRYKRKLTDEIIVLITEQLADNQRKRQEGLRKQIKLKIDIHEFILKQGHKIGYTTVCNYIRDIELRTQEAFIKQEYVAGEECEFDWAEVKLNIGGSKRRLYLAVFTSAFNNYRYCRLFHRQDTLAFMEAHNDFFAHMGGVYQEMVYDNMRVAVREFVGHNEKTPTDALLNLSGWFHFRWRFCNVRRGNEKGHVERSVELVRRKAFSDTDGFDTLAAAEAHLLGTCNHLNEVPGSTGKIPMASYAAELTGMWKYPGPMECFLAHQLKVDKYATISFSTNRYSVPDMLVGKMVEAKIYSNKLKIYYAHILIHTHDRSYGVHHWTISLDHYLGTLSRMPGALHGSVAISQAPESIRLVYDSWFKNQPRDFIELLQFCKEHQIEHQRLLETTIYVSGICPDNVTSEKIIALLGNQPGSANALPSAEINDEIENFSNLQLEEISDLLTFSIREEA